MKAVYITEHGGTDALTYGDLPEPEIGPNDVRIRVRACALNRLDLYTRAGVRGTRIRFNGVIWRQHCSFDRDNASFPVT